MRRRVYFIIDASECEPEPEVTGLNLVKNKYYDRYIENHGHHFTTELADYVTKLMENADKSKHNWSAEDVSNALKEMGVKIPATSTIGDVAYSANMAYADYYPDVLPAVNMCLKYAEVTANDPDGYEGMVFNRWLADAMSNDMNIDWKMFI